MVQAYSGEIQVQNDEFELNAQRLICRENEVAFDLSGNDEYGNFRIEGVAVKTESGFYISPELDVKYLEYSSQDKASIKFTEVNQNQSAEMCHIVGSWKQVGDEWNFSSKLKARNRKQS